MGKPKIAVFSFASCEGCQLTFLNLEDELATLLKFVDIVNFREAIDEKSEDYDIAFAEGSITTPHGEEEIKHIRERAKVLVAFGACASTGGLNTMRNWRPLEENREIVYPGEGEWPHSLPKANRVEDIVPVDYKLYGCPPPKSEILEVTHALLQGRKPRIPDYPVCVECRMKENVCVFEKGMFCLGPVTRAGCGALCPSYGNRCVGCRGLVDNPNTNAAKDVLAERGLTVDDVMRQLRLFFSYSEAAK